MFGSVFRVFTLVKCDFSVCGASTETKNARTEQFQRHDKLNCFYITCICIDDTTLKSMGTGDPK